MDKKYKDFEKKKLTTMIIEIDITKCSNSFRYIMNLINNLEKQQLSDYNLEIKDIYWK